MFLNPASSHQLVLSPNSQSGVQRALLPGASFLYRILSPTGPVSKLTDFLSSPNYIIVQRPLLLVGVTIALIQPIHGQGYNSDIPRPDAPVIYIGTYPILTVRPGRRSIYNNRTARKKITLKKQLQKKYKYERTMNMIL